MSFLPTTEISMHHSRHFFRRRRAMSPAPSVVLDAARIFTRNLLRRHGPDGFGRLDTHGRLSPLVAQSLGVTPISVSEPSPEDIVDADVEPGRGARHRKHLSELKAALARVCGEPLERLRLGRGAFARNLRRIGAEMGFDPVELEIVALLVVAALHPGMHNLLWGETPRRQEEVVDLVATALALRTSVVRERLQRESALRLSGLVEDADPNDPSDASLGVDRRLVELALEEVLRPGAVLKRFLSAEQPGTLAAGDFAHMAPDLDVAERMLRHALATGQVGVNLLLHGGPGTGKTEWARLLGERLGVPVYLAGASDARGESPSGRERLASAGVAQRLLPRGKALLLVDESEDVFGSGWMPFGQLDFDAKPVPSKLWLNRFLEQNRIPTIWTTNRLAGLDPALLRRFLFLVGFRPLGPAARRAVWKRHAGDELSPGELEALAQAHAVSPGEIGGAVTAAKLAGGGTLDRAALDRILAGGAAARPGHRAPPARRAGSEYRPEAVRASTDLVRLVERLVQWKPGADVGPSLCLYGKSGTGKSEFVHHLARRMGRQVVVRHPSDLMSKWHGETEQNIAAAFAEADPATTVLLLDEGDSLVRDRRFAQASWELAIVNEFLQQLEAYRGLAVVTTNLFRDLDQAVLRRFTFKVEFLPPLPDQVAALFQAHLAPLLANPREADDRAALGAALRGAGQLMPGDFAVVARKAALLHGAWRMEELVAELAAEALARGMEGRTVGF